MKTLFRCLAVAIAAAAFLAITQQRQIGRARNELARLETSAVGQNPKVLAATVSPSTEEEIKRLRGENRDIYKLRGQISQAREKRKELRRMQAENAQLREQIKNIKSKSEGSSSRTFSLVNKGQATPEAALETTFWSMSQGDIEALSRVMPIATMGWDKTPPEEQTENLTMLKVMASSIEKLEILDRKSDSPDEARLTVNIIPRGVTVNAARNRGKTTFVLRRTNDLWQIVGERRE